MNPFDNNDISTYTVETFGKSVRQRRKQLNLSGRELAKRIGVSPIYLSDIERSIRPVPASPKNRYWLHFCLRKWASTNSFSKEEL